MKQVKILFILPKLKEKHRKRLTELEGRIEIQATDDEERVAELIPQAEVLVCFPWHYSDQLLRRAANLSWIHALSAGVDQLLTPELANSNVQVTTSSGVHPIQISEHILGMMLAFTRNLHRFIRFQLKKSWNRDLQMEELQGKTLGIIGLGKIGRELARKAQCFGMEVLGVKRDISQGVDGVEQLFPPEELDEVLTRSDFVVILAPFTSKTHGMIGERELALMKNSAYLISISRGGIVDEEALVGALRRGEIAGAGLDVFATEPLPSDSPLWQMEQVLISPHIAGASPHYLERALEIFADNLNRYLEGRPLENLVERGQEY